MSLTDQTFDHEAAVCAEIWVIIPYARPMASGHLLVVDDEPSILGTLKKALTLEGYRVDVAGGAKLADSRVQSGAYDLVLLDVALPDGDGVQPDPHVGRARRGRRAPNRSRPCFCLIQTLECRNIDKVVRRIS